MLSWILVGAFGLPTTLAGQEHHERHGQMMEQGQGAMMMGMGHEHGMMAVGMMMEPGPDFLLEQKEALKLSDEQRSNVHFGLHLLHQMRSEMGEGMMHGGEMESHEEGGR
jgi:hypothetical protein